MLNSALRSRAEYAELGAVGLAARTTPERDALIVKAVEELLEGRESVLDLCCGYGRIALPLRKAGKVVRALDISPNLVAAGRAKAAEEELSIDWAIGSMTDLPYKWDSFDAVICLWTAFHELFAEDEQLSTICEISRVLKPGGIAIIEGPPGARRPRPRSLTACGRARSTGSSPPSTTTTAAACISSTTRSATAGSAPRPESTISRSTNVTGVAVGV